MQIKMTDIIENSEGISLEAKSLLPQVPHLFQLLLLLSIYHSPKSLYPNESPN